MLLQYLSPFNRGTKPTSVATAASASPLSKIKLNEMKQLLPDYSEDEEEEIGGWYRQNVSQDSFVKSDINTDMLKQVLFKNSLLFFFFLFVSRKHFAMILAL